MVWTPEWGKPMVFLAKGASKAQKTCRFLGENVDTTGHTSCTSDSRDGGEDVKGSALQGFEGSKACEFPRLKVVARGTDWCESTLNVARRHGVAQKGTMKENKTVAHA